MLKTSQSTDVSSGIFVSFCLFVFLRKQTPLDQLGTAFVSLCICAVEDPLDQEEGLSTLQDEIDELTNTKYTKYKIAFMARELLVR